MEETEVAIRAARCAPSREGARFGHAQCIAA